MNMTEADIPAPDYSKRHAKYERTGKGRARRERHNETRLERSLEQYLTRPFVAWDGEGINEEDDSHTYVVMANSLGESRQRREGLATREVFDWWLEQPKDVTHIIYGGGYDINMILKDVDPPTLRRLYTTGKAYWNDYFLQWRAKKSFSVKRDEKSFLLYDVIPFFQRPFVAACDEYLGKDWPYRDEIIKGKSRRGSFTWEEMESTNEYNRAELATLVRLADELRERLHKVEIRVGRWDGPGAIATALYKKYDTKSHLVQAPPLVAEAGRYAYAGGRFEIIRKGHSTSGAYQYDVRSAYPSAIRHLPCLAHGEWRHVEYPSDIARFGMYRIEIVDPPTASMTQPQPLWMRNPNGTVYFSEYSHGWYWSPEAQLAKEMGGAIFHEAWVMDINCDCNPFWFVEALYNKRAALKRAGDGAHVGLKLGLNSLYGKLAQQIGWSIDDKGKLRIPPYHSLEWAGYITSHCRAQVYRAAMHAPDDIIAFETDAVFSRVPLPVEIGERLGEWEETVYSDITYLKSGMYFGTIVEENGKKLSKPKRVEKMRGVNKGTITRADMIDALARERQGETVKLHAEQTRFITLGQALHQDFTKWRKWITAPREIAVPLNGKRIDLLDKADTRKDIGDGWRETQEGWHETDFSHPYEVAWVERTDIKNPDGMTLEEIRVYDAHDYEGEDLD